MRNLKIMLEIMKFGAKPCGSFYVLGHATPETSDADFYIRVMAQNGDKYFFPAKVMSFKRGFGSVDNVVTAAINLEITSATGGVGVVEDLAP